MLGRIFAMQKKPNKSRRLHEAVLQSRHEVQLRKRLWWTIVAMQFFETADHEVPGGILVGSVAHREIEFTSHAKTEEMIQLIRDHSQISYRLKLLELVLIKFAPGYFHGKVVQPIIPYEIILQTSGGIWIPVELRQRVHRLVTMLDLERHGVTVYIPRVS